MKKCGLFLILLLLVILNSCNNTPKESINQNNTNAIDINTVNEQLTESTISICDTVPLDIHETESPKLTYNINVAPITLSNKKATEKAVKAISYSLAGSESQSLAAACDIYTKKLVANYRELRPEYINTRDTEYAFRPNYEYIVSGVNETSRDGYTNYMILCSEYEGGAHPNFYITTFVFDTNDGHEVTLDELMKDGYEESLLQIITQELMNYFRVETIEELDRRIFNHRELFVSKNILLYNEAITFIYNRYEIAPYAAGEIILDIPYEKLKDVLK